MKKSWMLFACLALGSLAVHAQRVNVMDYASFEKHLNAQGDTLVLYNFWATWCKPCIKEMPYFEQLAEAYADQPLKVVYVSLDFADQAQTLVEPFVKRKGIQSEVILLDAPNYNDWINKISPQWTGSIPASLLSMPSKGIHAFKEQAFEYEELEAWVASTLQQVQP